MSTKYSKRNAIMEQKIEKKLQRREVNEFMQMAAQKKGHSQPDRIAMIIPQFVSNHYSSTMFA